MSAPLCPACGFPAAPRLTRRGAVFREHEPGGSECRLRAWEAEAERLDVVEIPRELVARLCGSSFVVYGLAFKPAAPPTRRYARVRFIPRWLAAIALACTGSDFEKAVTIVDGDAAIRSAVASAYRLSGADTVRGLLHSLEVL